MLLGEHEPALPLLFLFVRSDGFKNISKRGVSSDMGESEKEFDGEV